MNWAAPVTDHDSRVAKARKIIKVLEDFVSPLKGMKILDVGAGSGIVAGELTKYGNQVVAVDVTVRYADPACRFFILADATALPCRDASFDVVVCNHVLEHVRNPSALLSEARRVLRPGGYVYLAQDNRLWPIEPHYRLPFLSYLPKRLANQYVRLFRNVHDYEDIMLPTLWDVERIIFERFECVFRLTERILQEPGRYAAEDVVPAPLRGLLSRLPRRFLNSTRPFLPGWIYVLKN